MSSSPALANPSAPSLIDNKTVPSKNPNSNASSTNSNSNNNHNNDDNAGLSKTQRGRLKKLGKRARVLRTDTDLSGICKRQEWMELQEMFAQENPKNGNKSSFCPWIGNRNTKKAQQRQEGRIVEAVDQRQILKRLHCQNSLSLSSSTTESAPLEAATLGKRKRSREEEESKDAVAIPSWATLHNSACVDHVAVLEVHIQFNTTESHRISMENVEASIKTASSTAQPMAISWFQGPRVQSISDALLYEKPNKASQQSKEKTKALHKDKLINTLQSLTLDSQQWEREGYPIIQDAKLNQQSNDEASNKRMQDMEGSFRSPSSFTLEEAQAIVQKAQVYVKDKVFPFVVDCNTAESSSDELPRIFGMDCEMVETKMGRELARVTLIQYTGETNTAGLFQECYKVLMDDLVLPYDPILDYVTEYSGMTAKLLNGVATRLEQVQASLLHYVRKQDIVVGHSLENDLNACRWIHPNVLDTAVLFRSNGARKHSLKHLSNVLLQKKIQGESHHCSEEDAAAALELAVRRAQEGDSFAVCSKEKQWWIQSGKNNNGAACVFVGPSEWLQAHVTNHPNAIHALTCESIDSPNRKAILSWLTGPKRKAALVWAHLVLESAEHLGQLEDLLKEIQSKMTPNTVLMVNTQCGSEQASKIAKNRRIAQNPRTTMGWPDDQEQMWKEAVERCREGKTFWITHHQEPASKGNLVEENEGDK